MSCTPPVNVVPWYNIDDPQRAQGFQPTPGWIVDHVVDLRRLSRAGAGRAFLLGADSPGDGGGGLFRLDAEDISSADNGFDCVVALDGGRWKRCYTGTNPALGSNPVDGSGCSWGKGALPGHLQTRGLSGGSASRIYAMPNGRVSGVPAAIKVFLDDYYATTVAGAINYRDFGIYGDTSIKGPFGAGSFLLNSKTAGNFFGFIPQIGISRSDGNAICQRWVTINSAVSESDAATFAASYRGEWYAGLTVTAGDTVSASTGKAYRADNSGVCGATIPSHTSGSMSDGGISWTFLFDNAASSGSNIRMFAVIGQKDDTLWWTDSVPRDAGLHLTRDAVVYNGKGVYFLNGTGVPKSRMLCPPWAQSTYWQNTEGTAGIRLDFETTPFLQTIGVARLLSNITNSTSSATPDVGGCECLSFNYTGSVTVTGFTGGKAFQLLIVRGGTGTVTIANNANILTATGANRVLTSTSCLMFLADSSGSVWREVGRL